jgi:hypothetical protein
MNGYKVTKHCEQRMQQRAISKDVINVLIQFGVTLNEKGAEVTHLNHEGKELALKTWSCSRKTIEKASKAYLVEKDGCLITVAFKTKKHHWRV